jgi:hypothetical protein
LQRWILKKKFERVHILGCVPGHAWAALQELSFWPQSVHPARETALGLRALSADGSRQEDKQSFQKRVKN